MPKKLILFSGITILILITTLIFTFYDTDKKVLKNDKQEQIINSNSLTMMYETASGSGEYMVSNDSTWPQDGYVFNERLSGCENGSSLTWDDERKAVILSTSVSDKCYVYFDVEVITLADYIINEVYTGTDGENGLYLHDGEGTYGSLEAGDNSYRFSGANPNNYVCFGSNEASCLEDNLYRIIGVFNNQVKLIKATSYRSGSWDMDFDNTWDATTKPYIYNIK